MNRILNSVLVAVVAFFALLALFTFSGLRPADGGGAAPGATLTAVEAGWVKEEDAPALELALTVQAHGHTAEARVIRYETTIDGTTFDSGTVRVDEDIPVGDDATLVFTTGLGKGFASTWWPEHARADGASTITVRGTLELREGGKGRDLPFHWSRAWQGSATALFDGLQDCPSLGSPVCLEGATAAWHGSGLLVRLEVRNQETRDLRAGGGEVTLSLGGSIVARGTVPAADLPEGESATIPVELAFDDRALDRWWPAHVARCESSPAQVHLEVEVERASGLPLGTAAWDGPAATFTTAFVCHAEAA